MKRYDADPYLALYWVLWPSDKIEDAVREELRGGRDPYRVTLRRRPEEA